MILFENNLLLQSDVVFDSESNGRNFSPLAPGGEKKIIFKNLEKTPTPTRDVILKKKLKIIFSRHQVALES